MKEQYFSLPGLQKETEEMILEITSGRLKSNPRKWNADISRSALIVTDMQNYFLNPDSHAFIPSATSIIPNILSLADFFHKSNRPVIFTKHTNDHENAACMSYWWKDMIGNETPSAKIHENLRTSGDIILEKHQYDAFYNTRLEEILHNQNVRFAVICGVMTNLCCETTTRSAFVKGFQPLLPLDATAAYNREFHISTFINLSFGFCPLMTTREVIEVLMK